MTAKKTPVFSFKKCISCSICVQLCPVSAIALTERAGKADSNLYPKAGDDCLGCGSCERGCPMGAIRMTDAG